MELLGVDGGNKVIKVYGENGEYKIAATLGEYRELSSDKKLGPDDVIFEYKGRKGFAGTLAESESEFNYSIGGDSKAHEDIAVRVLLGICKYSADTEFKIVVGQPIVSHRPAQKEVIKQYLKGEHEFVLGDIVRHINITHVEVGAEGAAAYWSNPQQGVVHILDIGSHTVNAATFIDGAYQDKSSFTISEFGTDTVNVYDAQEMAKAIYSRCYRKKWRNHEKVMIAGGRTAAFVEPLKAYFEDVVALTPKIHQGSKLRVLSPIYANAVAFYNIAKEVYADEEAQYTS